MADNRLFSPPGVVAMGNALSSRMSRPNLYFVEFFQRNILCSSGRYIVSADYGKTLIYWTHGDSSLIGERIKATLVPKRVQYLCCISIPKT